MVINDKRDFRSVMFIPKGNITLLMVSTGILGFLKYSAVKLCNRKVSALLSEDSKFKFQHASTIVYTAWVEGMVYSLSRLSITVIPAIYRLL